MSIFSDIMEKNIEMFMYYFFLVGESFDRCLHNLAEVLKRCEKCTLVLNLKKSHFIIKECVVLGHQIS